MAQVICDLAFLNQLLAKIVSLKLLNITENEHLLGNKLSHRKIKELLQ